MQKLKIAIFTEQDYVFLFPAWKKFLESEENYEVVGIFVFPGVLGKHKGFKIPLYYLRAFGIITVLKLIILTTVATFHRYFTGGPHSYKDLAHAHSAAFEKHSNPNKQQVINRIKEMDVDIILSTCGFIFKKQILDAPKIGVINKHAGPLPSYRGLMPVFWTLLEGQEKVGVTIHFMDKEIDKGIMIMQHMYTQDFDTIEQAYEKVYEDFPKMMWDALDIVQSKGPYPKYPDRPASYFSLPTRNDYKWLKKQGKRFI